MGTRGDSVLDKRILNQRKTQRAFPSSPRCMHATIHGACGGSGLQREGRVGRRGHAVVIVRRREREGGGSPAAAVTPCRTDHGPAIACRVGTRVIPEHRARHRICRHILGSRCWGQPSSHRRQPEQHDRKRGVLVWDKEPCCAVSVSVCRENFELQISSQSSLLCSNGDFGFLVLPQ